MWLGHARAKLLMDRLEVIKGKLANLLIAQAFDEQLANSGCVPGCRKGGCGKWGVGRELSGELIESSVALIGFVELVAEDLEEEGEGITAVYAMLVGQMSDGGFDTAVDRVAFRQASTEKVNSLIAEKVT